MCLAVPAKILSIDGDLAVVDVGGNRVQASLALTPDARVGDYVMVHAGFAICQYEPQEAEETLRLLDEARALAGAPEPAS